MSFGFHNKKEAASNSEREPWRTSEISREKENTPIAKDHRRYIAARKSIVADSSLRSLLLSLLTTITTSVLHRSSRQRPNEMCVTTITTPVPHKFLVKARKVRKVKYIEKFSDKKRERRPSIRTTPRIRNLSMRDVGGNDNDNSQRQFCYN